MIEDLPRAKIEKESRGLTVMRVSQVHENRRMDLLKDMQSVGASCVFNAQNDLLLTHPRFLH